MRNAYALLGLSFLIVLFGAYLIVSKAHAPSDKGDTVENLQR